MASLIIRVRTYNNIRGSMGRRFINFLSFAGMATIRAMRVGRVDLVYASSTPLTTGLAGCAISMLKRRPFYFEVRDLWPRSAVVAGVLHEGAFVRCVEWFERLFYRRAVKVIALTEGISKGVIAAGKNPADVILVPNGMDDWMTDVRPNMPSLYPFDLARDFICTYIGAHGRWNKIETILEAAHLLGDTHVRFLLVGDGDHKGKLQSYARSLGLTNVTFLDAIPKRHVIDYLNQSHVAIICTWDHQFSGWSGQQGLRLSRGRVSCHRRCPRRNRGVNRSFGGRMDHSAGAARTAGRADSRVDHSAREELSTRGARGREYVRHHYLRSTLADQLQRTFVGAAGSA